MSLLIQRWAKSPSFFLNPLLVLVVFKNLFAATWNVDPYHEGALFPTAVGLAEGRSPFREISQQYGFLGPLLVSLPLRIFGNYLLVERLFGFVLIISISFLFYLNLKTLTTPLISKYLPLFWLSISPIWSWPIQNPALSGGYWPNHLGVALLLFGLVLISKTGFSVFFAGFIIFLSSQARMEFYFVWMFITIAVFIKERGKRLYWISGSLCSALLVFVYLAVNNSQYDWLQQTLLVWAMDAPDLPVIGLSFFLYNFINFLGVAFIGCVLVFSSYLFATRISKQWLAVAAQSLIIILFLTLSTKISLRLMIGNYDVISSIRYSLTNALFSYINLSIIGGIVIITLVLAKNSKDLVTKFKLADSRRFILLSASIGLLSLFHNFNPDYTQMIWPVFALLIMDLQKSILLPVRKYISNKLIKVFSAGMIIASSFLFFSHANVQIHGYESPFLKGIYGDSLVDVQTLDQSFFSISDSVQKNRMLMVCRTGLFTVNLQGYLGSDKWTWNQQPADMISNRMQSLEPGHTILACNLNEKDSTRIQSLLTNNYLEIIYKNPSFTLYKVVKSL